MEQQSTSIDIQFILNRVKSVATNPKGVWATIKGEPDSIADIYKKFVFVLAAIPPLCSFLGMSILGVPAPLTNETIRTPVVSGLIGAVIQYALALAFLYIAAAVAEFVAPKFDGKGTRVDAFKLFAYSMGPVYVAGVLSLVPMLSIISLLVSLYCLYVWYQGVDVMMEIPAGKKIPYVLVTIIALVIVSIVFGVITMMLGMGAMMTAL